MRTTATCLLLTACCAAFLVGCAERPAPAPADGASIVLGLPQFLMPERSSGMQEALAIAKAECPDVRPTLRPYVGNTDRILQKLRLELSGSQAPDLVLVKGGWVAELAAAGQIRAWEAVPPEVSRDWLPAFRSMADASGARLAVPFDADVRVLWYRRDLFEQEGLPLPMPGWTFESFAEAAKRLTADTDGDGRIDRWGFGIPLVQSPKAAGHVLPWLLAAGGHGTPRDAAEAMRGGPGFLSAFRRLVREAKAAPPSLPSMDQDAVFSGLAGGLFAMTAGGSWERAMLRRQSEFADRIVPAEIPVLAPGAPMMTVCEGWHVALVARDAARSAAALRLALALVSPAAQRAKWVAEGLLPVCLSCYDDDAFRRDPASATFAHLAVRAVGPMDTSYLRPAVADAVATAVQEVLVAGVEPHAAWEKVVRRLFPGSVAAP